jgi:trans-2-enoyl-CoA reductase
MDASKCKNQIKYVQSKGAIAGGKKVLVIELLPVLV